MVSQAAQDIATYHLKPVAFIALPVVLLVLAAVSVALRFYVRAVLLKTFGLDDWLLLAAFTVFSVDAGIFIKIGSFELDPGLSESILNITSWSLAGMLVYLVDQILLKMSMAVFFVRIVREKWQKNLIYISMSIYATYGIAFVFVALFQCGNPKAINFIEDKCMDWATIIGPMNYISASFNAIIDWIFILTPILVVIKAMIPLRAKLIVSFLILLGAVGSVASVVRIPLIHGLKIEPTLFYYTNLIPIGLLSITESGVGILAISLATLRPLFGSQLASRNKNSGYGNDRTSGRQGVMSNATAKSQVHDGMVTTMNKPGDDGMGITVTTVIGNSVGEPKVSEEFV